MVKKQIKKIVIDMSIKFVLIFKFDEAKTLGMIRNTENGFRIPPDKYSKKLNCIISKKRYINEVSFES